MLWQKRQPQVKLEMVRHIGRMWSQYVSMVGLVGLPPSSAVQRMVWSMILALWSSQVQPGKESDWAIEDKIWEPVITIAMVTKSLWMEETLSKQV